jgi:hypothetical protein
MAITTDATTAPRFIEADVQLEVHDVSKEMRGDLVVVSLGDALDEATPAIRGPLDQVKRFAWQLLGQLDHVEFVRDTEAPAPAETDVHGPWAGA